MEKLVKPYRLLDPYGQETINIILKRETQRVAELSAVKTEIASLKGRFEKMIWIQTHGAFRFSDLDSKLQRQFFELLFNNYEYASSELKELLYCFKSSYDSIPEFGVEDSDRIFFEIENNISEGFNALSKTLFLEPYCLKKSKKVLKRLSKSL